MNTCYISMKSFPKNSMRLLYCRETKHPPNLGLASPLAAPPHGLFRLLDVELGVTQKRQDHPVSISADRYRV